VTGDDPVRVRLTVNGESHRLALDPARRLAAVLRDDLGLFGTKLAGEVGVCGACTVLVDGRPTSSCLALAVEIDGRSVVTVEGIAALPFGERLQAAFVEHGGFQCGFCTSGQLLTAAWTLNSDTARELSDGELREQLLGNLCRCTGYYGILRAIKAAKT
jgi:carbon-monoxide dehydrogenase small subunit